MALGSNIPQPESISGSPPGWPMMVRAGGWFQGAALPSFTGRTFSYYFCMVCQEIFFFARQERARRGHPVTRGHGHSHGALARQFGRCGNRGREGGKIKGKGRRSLGADGIRLKQKATKTPVSRHECLEKQGPSWLSMVFGWPGGLAGCGFGAAHRLLFWASIAMGCDGSLVSKNCSRCLPAAGNFNRSRRQDSNR